MEAWKFVDYKDISPAYALSLTTERWGLEPFPFTLAATTGRLSDLDGNPPKASTLDAFTVPVVCDPYYVSYSSNSCKARNYFDFNGDGVRETNYWEFPFREWDTYNETVSITLDTRLCEPQTARAHDHEIAINGTRYNYTVVLPCRLVIERTGSRRLGNGLVHAVIAPLAVVFTVLIAIATEVMGCFGSKPTPADEDTAAQQIANHATGKAPAQPTEAQRATQYALAASGALNPPLNPGVYPYPLYQAAPGPTNRRVEAAATGANFAVDVARCAELLRQLYSKDFEILSLASAEDSARAAAASTTAASSAAPPGSLMMFGMGGLGGMGGGGGPGGAAEGIVEMERRRRRKQLQGEAEALWGEIRSIIDGWCAAFNLDDGGVGIEPAHGGGRGMGGPAMLNDQDLAMLQELITLVNSWGPNRY